MRKYLKQVGALMLAYVVGIAFGYFICWKNSEADRLAVKDAREFQETINRMITENTGVNEKLIRIIKILEEGLGPDTFFWIKQRGENAFEKILEDAGKER